MFTVIFHDEAEKEFVALPAAIRARMSRILAKLESNPRQLREPDTKPWATGYLKSGQWAPISHEDCGYIRAGSAFFY